MKLNPLIATAAEDRHIHCCQNQFCRACGSHVSGYNANEPLIAARPEGAKWDWWLACDNADCPNAEGEGLFQELPDWVETRPAVA